MTSDLSVYNWTSIIGFIMMMGGALIGSFLFLKSRKNFEKKFPDRVGELKNWEQNFARVFFSWYSLLEIYNASSPEELDFMRRIRFTYITAQSSMFVGFGMIAWALYGSDGNALLFNLLKIFPS